MFKNMTPKQKIIIAVIVILIIAAIIFFAVRAKNKKKKFQQEADRKIGGEKNAKTSEPTPAEGGDFRVIPDEDNPLNIPEEKPAKKPVPQQQKPAQVQQKPHLNVTGKTRGGALPPMQDDLASVVSDESSFTGTLFNVDTVYSVSKSKRRNK